MFTNPVSNHNRIERNDKDPLFTFYTIIIFTNTGFMETNKSKKAFKMAKFAQKAITLKQMKCIKGGDADSETYDRLTKPQTDPDQ